MFALVDANAYYCSAEQVFRPDWRGKPIVVLSNNDGCVVAANRQAKEAGINKFGPYFKQKSLCESKGIIALSSNYELYADLSAKMMAVIGQFSPDQYIYSIDETFLSFEQLISVPDLVSYGQQIRKRVWKECRLPVCVGIGPTLTLAKAANHAAKKLKGYQGVCAILSETQRQSVLSRMTPSDVWGIGRKLTKHLAAMEITTAWQLANMPPALVAKRFSIEIERTVRELAGQACQHWRDNSAGKVQIFSTRSVGKRINCLSDLQQALGKHASIVAEKLRQQGSRCVQLQAFAHNSPFDKTPLKFSHQQRLAVPTNDTTILSRLVTQASIGLYRQGIDYYKVGVGAVELQADSNVQFDFFNEDYSNTALMAVMDSINHRYGTNTLALARQVGKTPWQMRRERLTPQYTTKWQCIPKIHC